MKPNNTVIAGLCAGALLTVGNFANAQTAVVTTAEPTSGGTVTEFSPDSIVIRSETSPEPIHYVFRKTTAYVDEDGNPVSTEIVKSGVPVTVQYVREGGELVARKVIVRRLVKRVVPAAPIVEERTRVVPAPPVIEERTRVVPAPPVVEERTKIVPAAPPIIEEKTTTTTTTTTK